MKKLRKNTSKARRLMNKSSTINYKKSKYFGGSGNFLSLLNKFNNQTINPNFSLEHERDFKNLPSGRNP